LLPEIKTLYERIIIALNEYRKSTRIIAAYYEYLKSIEFKYNESIEKFLKDNELFTMLGVQPDTR
jgi:predicted house-cleaning noncanonical NTP pyrophosphatase (MazG superfamily)